MYRHGVVCVIKIKGVALHLHIQVLMMNSSTNIRILVVVLMMLVVLVLVDDRCSRCSSPAVSSPLLAPLLGCGGVVVVPARVDVVDDGNLLLINLLLIQSLLFVSREFLLMATICLLFGKLMFVVMVELTTDVLWVFDILLM